MRQWRGNSRDQGWGQIAESGGPGSRPYSRHMSRGRSTTIRSAPAPARPPARYLDEWEERAEEGYREDMRQSLVNIDQELVDPFGCANAAQIYEALTALPAVASAYQSAREAGDLLEAEYRRVGFISISHEVIRLAGEGYLRTDPRAEAAIAAARIITETPTG